MEDYMPVVIAAEHLHDYSIKVTFDNGEERIVDCKKWLYGEVFEQLKDPEYFKKFFVDGWSISWPNGTDLSPESLYNDETPVVSS